MKRLICIILVSLLGFIYADGIITVTNGKDIKVDSLQSGSIILSTDYKVAMNPTMREVFLRYLKAHLDSINKFQTDNIKVSNTSQTTSIYLSDKLQYRFFIMVNEVKESPYLLSLRLYEYNELIETYTFDSTKLNEYINLLDGTKTNTETNRIQNDKVFSEVSKLRSMM